MPRNAFLDESRNLFWNLGLRGWIDRLRVQPTVAEILDAARPATMGRGDFVLHGTLKAVLISDIMTGHFRRVYDTLGRILGVEGTGVTASHERGERG